MVLTVTANAAIDKRYIVDGFEPGEVNRVKSCIANAGGKGINVARVASIAGESVVATGFLGGNAGRFIAERIEQNEIKNEFVWCNGESRSCINIWDQKTEKQTEFLEPGFCVDESDCENLLAKFEKLLLECKAVSISGSLPSGADSRLYKRMIAAARRKNTPVILDTSGQCLMDCLEECPTMIKPNIDEIRWLLNREINDREEIINSAKELHERGIAIVVVSLGAKGSIAVCEDGAFDVKVPRIQTVNTVGCGDSMVAGFLAGMARKYAFPEILRLASAISAANAMNQETGFYLEEDRISIMSGIEIAKI